MKILMITPYLPFPLSSGGQIRTYNLLKNLSKKHQISLFSFIRTNEEKKYIPKLKEFCIDVKTFSKRPPWSITSLTLSALSLYPLVVCMYLKKELKQEIQEAIGREHFDLIHAETFYVMPNIPLNNIPTILVEQTIEYLVYKHFTETIKMLPLKLLMEFDVHKINYWEKKFWQKASRVVAMSDADKKVMRDQNPTLTVDLVPNGVDTDFFKLESRLDHKTQTVLFVGNFKWLQNREAVAYLVNQVWPQITKRLPKARLWIVGKFPTTDVLKLGSNSVQISSDIEDIREAYSNSDVLLAPIYGPGGTRYKILESMATGLPVVTTPIGIEGLNAVHNREALIGKTKQMLASETVRVLTDRNLYRILAINGRKLVEKNFNWKIIASRLNDIYLKASHERKN